MTDQDEPQPEGEISPSEREELREMEQEAQRSGATRDAQLNIFEGIRAEDGNPIQPVRLAPDDGFCFSCHAGVSCWNRCCHGADITLTPNCILRLCRALELTPTDFLRQYTVPALFGMADLPVAKLRMGGDDGKGPCPFMVDAGCSVYGDRPATCRYYPLGLASVKHKEMEQIDDFYFLVRESHCTGHAEPNAQTVADYRRDQGVEEYDAVNRGWMDILMKMASWNGIGGPWGETIDTRKKQMFFMATTDVVTFRRFVFETKFLETYEIDEESLEILRTSDEALLALATDWLKTVFFNEPTVPMKTSVLQSAIAKYREEMGAA